VRAQGILSAVVLPYSREQTFEQSGWEIDATKEPQLVHQAVRAQPVLVKEVGIANDPSCPLFITFDDEHIRRIIDYAVLHYPNLIRSRVLLRGAIGHNYLRGVFVTKKCPEPLAMSSDIRLRDDAL